MAHDPLPASGRAGVLHLALVLGGNARVPQRTGIRRRMRPFWLRRDSERCQSRLTWNRKIVGGGWFMGTVVEKVSTHNRPQALALFGED